MKLGYRLDQKTAWAMIFAFVAIGVYYGTVNLFTRGLFWALMGWGSALFLLIPVLVKKLGLAQPYRFYSFLFFYCIFAYDLGCVNEGYQKYEYLDKWSHFLSGIVFTILGFFLYLYLERPKNLRDKWYVAVSYALFFSMFIAAMWEIIEFIDFNLTGHDGQNHLTTGVYDTMYDLIFCFAASLLSSLSYVLYVKKGWKLVTGGIVEEFYQALPAAYSGS